MVKHAKASVATIHLSPYGNCTQLTISDNGKGFNVDEKRSGIGFNIRVNRAKVFGGELKIDSLPGNGCFVHVSIPILAEEDVVVKN